MKNAGLAGIIARFWTVRHQTAENRYSTPFLKRRWDVADFSAHENQRCFIDGSRGKAHSGFKSGGSPCSSGTVES